MVDIKLKYQGSLFLDISWLKPEGSSIKSLMDLFADYELIPTTFTEAVPEHPVRSQRLMLTSSDTGIQIVFASNRIDIVKFPTDLSGNNIPLLNPD